MVEAVTSCPPVITADIEDWSQSTWDRSLPIHSVAVRNSFRLLEVLARHDARITCFVLGKLAEAHPEIVRAISAAGHEVASHGYAHVEIFRQTPDEFREDVHRSKALLEDVTGEPCRGYRAPDFSVVRSTLWALRILAEEGYSYDSSVFPVRHARYGIPEWSRKPMTLQMGDSRTIVELPIATLRCLGVNLPMGGGGYHRALPGPVLLHLVRALVRSGNPQVFYCHPYEFNPGEFQTLQFRVPMKVRLHQGLGRRGFEAKFESILSSFGARTAVSVANERKWANLDLDAWQGAVCE